MRPHFSIAEIDDPQSIFTKITQVQWDRVSPGARETLFVDVGLQHVRQYLEVVRRQSAGLDEYGEQLYLLPTTEQIEGSYRKALDGHGLSVLTAVDSMFSVFDWNLERSNEWIYVLARENGNVEDVSWKFFEHSSLYG